jgi:hypothetical protein
MCSRSVIVGRRRDESNCLGRGRIGPEISAACLVAGCSAAFAGSLACGCSPSSSGSKTGDGTFPDSGKPAAGEEEKRPRFQCPRKRAWIPPKGLQASRQSGNSRMGLQGSGPSSCADEAAYQAANTSAICWKSDLQPAATLNASKFGGVALAQTVTADARGMGRSINRRDGRPRVSRYVCSG